MNFMSIGPSVALKEGDSKHGKAIGRSPSFSPLYIYSSLPYQLLDPDLALINQAEVV